MEKPFDGVIRRVERGEVGEGCKERQRTQNSGLSCPCHLREQTFNFLFHNLIKKLLEFPRLFFFFFTTQIFNGRRGETLSLPSIPVSPFSLNLPFSCSDREMP